MKLIQKTLNVFKFYTFPRIFATRNDEKNTIYIMLGLCLFFHSVSRRCTMFYLCKNGNANGKQTRPGF